MEKVELFALQICGLNDYLNLCKRFPTGYAPEQR
jgi:hypothetical protein